MYNTLMTIQVLVIDSVGDILMEGRFRDSHYEEMCRRGWIKQNGWIYPGQVVDTIRMDKLTEFFKEAGI